MKDILSNVGLNTENSVVIGSGILQALGIRRSEDVDLVVSQEIYDLLKKSGNFTLYKSQYKNEVLKMGLFEIVVDWDILGSAHRFEDLLSKSVIIDEVRYITIDFLYEAKKSWVDNGTARQKDLDDLILIEKYLKNLRS